MGIPGLLKELGRGERIALAKLAVDHLESHGRPLRLAIDAAIWDFQHQAGQGGKNPALRTLFYRLLRLLALPIQPVFVYDGKHKPLTKRGKTVSRYGSCIPSELSKNLVARFQFPHHTAPGEAEAECAFLQRNGIVDAVMSQDVDAIMFGSTLTLRDWSKEGTKGNKAPTHVSLLRSTSIHERSQLDTAGMVLVALLSGGDYNDGVPGFGPALSCSIARAGFGTELIELINKHDEEGLREWRERLQYELETNESGYFHKRHKTLKLPNDFPNPTVLKHYLEPAVSKIEDLKQLEARWAHWWNREIDISTLRDYVGITFDWMYKGGAIKFIRCLAQPLFQHRLKMQRISVDAFSIKDITEQRKHPVTDGTPELRLSVVPADVVGINLEEEEENPEFADIVEELGEEAIEGDGKDEISSKQENCIELPDRSVQKPSPTWNPYRAEKWWVPQHILKVGLPTLLTDWEREQREIKSDPKRFATRKYQTAAKAAADSSQNPDQCMRQRALKDFMPVQRLSDKRVDTQLGSASHDTINQRKRKPIGRTKSNPLSTFSTPRCTIDNYFDVSKAQFSTLGHLSTEANQSPTPQAVSDSKDIARRADGQRIKSSLSRSHTVPLDGFEELASDTAAVLDTAVVARRRRPLKESVNAADIVYTGTSRLPPPISSFFGKPGLAKEDTDASTRQIIPSGTLSSSTGTVSKPDHCAELSVERQVEEQPHVDVSSTINFGGLGERNITAHQRPTLQSLDDAAPRKKLAVSRDSLPGAWRELLPTPSRSSKIAYIDLTGV